ncbi:MAG: serine/threonine-protein kinase [Sporichthyaceae bacterium]
MSIPGAAPAPLGPLVANARVGEDGRYTLIRLLGIGGMASVWSARDSRLHREVAIKVISDTLALDPEFLARFTREARIVAALTHPHVVAVFDYSTACDRPYLVMEYVAGGTLSARLKDGRRDWDPLVLAGELLDALAYIHAAGVLHRDLKPANVLIGADGRARLTDFGIAHMSDGTQLTSTGLVVGTEKYLAPELRSGAAATVASDLYSCGVLLRECIDSDAPSALLSLIAALTHSDPAARPASAADARALLDVTAGDLPTQAMTVQAMTVQAPTEPIAVAARTAPTTSAAPTAQMAAPTRSSRPGRRTLALLGAGLAVVTVLVIGLLLAGDDGAEPLRVPAPGGSLSEQLDRLDEAIDNARP